MFGLFGPSKQRKLQARRLYEKAALQGRTKGFYQDLGVPDTIDGRYEMIIAHVSLMVGRLNELGETKLSQKLFDVTYRIMEKSIREIGVGDLSVPKHMKRMMKGFKGRALHYHIALKQGDDDVLVEAVMRNVYGTAEKPSKADATKMADYFKRVYGAMIKLSADELEAMKFPAIKPAAKKKALKKNAKKAAKKALKKTVKKTAKKTSKKTVKKATKKTSKKLGKKAV